ncbi:MAG: site-2 protease family protein [Gemmatimonadales bacterium]|jgi:Zn-dependent protease/predicted transcriptional regulator
MNQHGGFRLGSVLGFEIRIDYSWFVIFALVLWSFSAGVFPVEYPGLTPVTYFAMGAAGTLLFFVSLLAHELSHSVVARSKGIPVEGITLFIFGGVAWTRLESETPADELLIAGVGPLASLVIAALFGGLAGVGSALGAPAPVTGVAAHLGLLNLALAVFNLLPGFPLDGGRLFRAIAWKLTGDATKATRWAANGGKALGYALMGLGVLQVFAGAGLGGLWILFIGWFLRGAAGASYAQHVLQNVLAGVTAADVMTSDPETVPAHLPLDRLVEEHFLKRRFQSFPVLDGGRLVGLVTLGQVKDVPRAEWPARSVADVMTPTSDRAAVTPGSPITEVLDEMRDTDTGRVLVARDGELVGIISAADITRWIQWSRDVEGLSAGSTGGGAARS